MLHRIKIDKFYYQYRRLEILIKHVFINRSEANLSIYPRVSNALSFILSVGLEVMERELSINQNKFGNVVLIKEIIW